MINTVLGKITPDQMGITLSHEHILWSNEDHDNDINKEILYDKDKAFQAMLPNLLALKDAGGKTFVDATPPGCGRCVSILKEFSKTTGLHIITNTGAFLDFNGRYILEDIKQKDINEIVEKWEDEYSEGIEGTGIKPGFIKIALHTDEVITDLEVKVLKAASKVSINTGLPIQCHVVYASKAKQAVNIVDAEGLPLDKFIWVHADIENKIETVIELAKRGVYVELDSWQREKKYAETTEIIKRLLDNDLLGKILLSQDSGTYGYFDNPIYPCTPILTEFLPYCLENGLSKDTMDYILITNPSKVFDID